MLIIYSRRHAVKHTFANACRAYFFPDKNKHKKSVQCINLFFHKAFKDFKETFPEKFLCLRKSSNYIVAHCFIKTLIFGKNSVII